MVSPSVQRTLRWLAGIDDDEGEQAAAAAPGLLDRIGQGVSDVGSAIGSAGSAVGDTVSSAAAALSDAYALPTGERRPQYTGPSYAQPRLAPGQPSMFEQLPQVAQAGIDAASETLGDRGRVLAGLRPPETPEEVISAAAPAPARAVQIASEVGSRAGGAVLGEFAERGSGTDPVATTPELDVGPVHVPAYPVTPRAVGTAIGSVLGDPTTYAGFGAAGRAADAPVQAALGAVGRGWAAGGRRAAGAVGSALTAAPTPSASPIMELGGGFIPQGVGVRGLWQQANSKLEALGSRLSAADDAVQAAERSGDAAAIRAADADYGRIRREHDAAVQAVEALRPGLQRFEGSLEAAGFGRNADEVGLADTGAAVPGDTRVRGPVSPFVDTSPREISLGSGVVPEGGEAARRRWVPDARYQGGGFWQTPEARVPADVRDAQRTAILAGADHRMAQSARAEAETLAARYPDDEELQRRLMDAVGAEERALESARAAEEWQQMVRTGDRTLGAGMTPAGPSGLRSAAYNAAQGGVFGAASESAQATEEGRETDPAEMGRRALIGGALGVGAGVAARRGAGRALGSGVVPQPSARISPLGQRVHDAYTAVTPERAERATQRTLEIASDAIRARRPRTGGMQQAPGQLVADVHAAIVANLADTKIVATGIRPEAIQAYLRGEGLTSKVDTRDLEKINEITRGQVNVAGGRAGKPYTIAEAADFAQRESEQMRVATGGTRFPDPETGVVDEAAPRVMYGYVSEGQPLVGPNRPTAWLVWDDDTPRVTSAHHPYGLTSPGQDIHASMPPGLKAAIWGENAIAGGRAGPAVMEGGRLVEAAPGVPGASPMTFGWEREGLDVGEGRKIAQTDWLVGPEGEDAMRANGLILGMPKTMQRAIAGGSMTDPEQIAAVLMRGGSPKWKGGWGAVMNPSRSESLILDPDVTKIKAIYLTGSPKDLATPIAGGGRAGARPTELEVAQKIRADILAQTNGEKDVPILFNDISQSAPSASEQAAGVSAAGWSPRLISDAQLLEGPPLTLSPGRAAIRDQYTAAGYSDIGAGMVPGQGSGLRAGAYNAAQGAVLGAASESAQATEEGRETDPAETARRALIGAGLGVGAGVAARRGGARGAARALGSGVVPGGVDPDEIADLARRAAETPMTGPHSNGEHVVRNVGQQIKKQVDAGIPAAVPDGPMAPPDPPPGFWDHVENWRYNVGLFGQLSTGLVQAGGGAIEALGGGTAEALRLGVLRGQPEAIPGILGAAARAVPGGISSSLRTAAGQVPEAIEAGSDYRPSLGARERAAGRPGRALAADILGTPGRVVTQAPDAFWHEIFYRTGLQQAAADQARAELGGSPLKMGERAARQAELAANPTPEIEAAAATLARDATYKGEPGPIFGAPKTAARAVQERLPEPVAAVTGNVGNLLMPIYNTIARIHERALEYTPGVGMLPLDTLGLAPRGHGRPMPRRLAQQAVGLGLVAGGMQYAAAGGIRGPGPSNANTAQAMRDEGYTPNTTNIGGYWIPNAWLGPWGPILNEIGAVNDAILYDDAAEKWDEGKWWQVGESIVKNSARAFRDYPALDTAATVQELFTHPTRALTSLLGEVAGQYVPGPVRTATTAADPLARTRTQGEDVPPGQRVLETFEQRSGIRRQTLPGAQDILGRDVENPRQGWAALLPNVRPDQPDPIIGAYLDADVAIGDPARQLTVPGLKDPADKPELTPEEQRRWNTLRGESIIRTVGPAVEDPGFAQASPENRQAFLEKRRAAAAEEAHARLRSEIGAQEINRRISERQRRKAS